MADNQRIGEQIHHAIILEYFYAIKSSVERVKKMSYRQTRLKSEISEGKLIKRLQRIALVYHITYYINTKLAKAMSCMITSLKVKLFLRLHTELNCN